MTRSRTTFSNGILIDGSVVPAIYKGNFLADSNKSRLTSMPFKKMPLCNLTCRQVHLIAWSKIRKAVEFSIHLQQRKYQNENISPRTVLSRLGVPLSFFRNSSILCVFASKIQNSIRFDILLIVNIIQNKMEFRQIENNLYLQKFSSKLSCYTPTCLQSKRIYHKYYFNFITLCSFGNYQNKF